MSQYLLKASELEFDSWRAAASGPLAPWIRRVLNEAAAGPSTRSVGAVGGVTAEAGEVGTRERPRSESSFRPDFGKRLKP